MIEHPGVTYYNEDRDHGPFTVRIGGTNEFVSAVDPDWNRCWPPGKIDVVKGWDNQSVLKFDTIEEALAVADQVWSIEGFHTSIERNVR